LNAKPSGKQIRSYAKEIRESSLKKRVWRLMTLQESLRYYDPKFRRYLGACFKTAKGDLANFSNEILSNLGKKETFA
jgi:hypothetical protein